MSKRQLNVRLDETSDLPLAKLRALHGIDELTVDEDCLRLNYDVRATNCARLIEDLRALGLNPALARGERWRIALRAYRESIWAEDFNNEIGWDSFVREIYVSRYRHRRHGRRDDRPHHWRQYLNNNPVD